MELTVYRQATKLRPDGTIVYKGEDGVPYVDGQVLFVADGLGGASAIRHQKFKQELFDSEKLLDTLFQGIYEDYSNEQFVDYVVKSFYELFAVKDCYTDNVNNMKKSGYFASRIVTAIILHEMLYNRGVSADTLFEAYAKQKELGRAKEFLHSIAEHFKRVIQRDLRSIAKNANLVYESSYAGLALLGSTLCATIYLEHEDYVDAIYLTAGDSRPYVWTEKQGLQQVLRDQEGKDGGMTNYIRANEDLDFEVNCDYFRFEKPCIIFNATDGCFDSGRFFSQLAFEKLILETACASETTEQMSEGLKAFFLDYGRHDDSSTIAMKICGYPSFEAFKKSAKARMEELNKEYFSVMPELLDADYVAELEQCKRANPTKLAALKAKLESEPGVLAYCECQLRPGDGEYAAAISEINSRIADKNREINASKNVVYSIIMRNFIGFIPALEINPNMTDSHYLKIIGEVKSKYQKTERAYYAQIQQYKEDLDRAAQELSVLLERINEIGIPDRFEDFDGIDYRLAGDCGRTIDGLLSFIDGLRSKRLDIVRKLIQQKNDYYDKNKQFAVRKSHIVDLIYSKLIRDLIDVKQPDIFPKDRAILAKRLDIIKCAMEQIDKLETEEKGKLLNEAVKKYWEQNYEAVIKDIVDKPCQGISVAMLMEAKAVMEDINKQTEGVRGKGDMQRELLEKYDKGYCTYIGGCVE